MEFGLGKSTLTDWFIHEARNALAVTIEGVKWSKRDYTESRQILKRFLANSKNENQNIAGEGELSRSRIEEFVRAAVSKPWNKNKAGQVKSDFDKLLESIGQ